MPKYRYQNYCWIWGFWEFSWWIPTEFDIWMGAERFVSWGHLQWSWFQPWIWLCFQSRCHLAQSQSTLQSTAWRLSGSGKWAIWESWWTWMRSMNPLLFCGYHAKDRSIRWNLYYSQNWTWSRHNLICQSCGLRAKAQCKMTLKRSSCYPPCLVFGWLSSNLHPQFCRGWSGCWRNWWAQSNNSSTAHRSWSWCRWWS